jgi:RNA polymerase sigma-70 factor (ECF subfamily)
MGADKHMQEANLVYQYSNMLYKICFFILWNEQDAQDAVQETFYKYCKSRKKFHDSEHEKAWLIRVATNISHDLQRFKLRHTTVAMYEVASVENPTRLYEVSDAIIKLPDKLKIVIYLYCVAGYSQKEIGKILKISPAAVSKRIQRGREKLKHILLEDAGKSEHT